LGAVLLVLVLVALVCATVYESTHGTEQVMQVFYGSRWFRSLLGLLGVSVLAAVVSRLPMGRPRIGFLLTHGALLLILVGALVTSFFGIDGQLALTEGETADSLRASGQEDLTLANRATGAAMTLALDRSIFGRLVAAESPMEVGGKLGELYVRVARYLPDSVPTTVVLNDARAERTAVEVSLSGSGVDDPAWVLEGEPRTFGEVAVSVANLHDESELDENLHPGLGPTSTSVGSLKVRIANAEYELPVESCAAQPAALADSGYSIRVLEYLPHATVATGGGVTNASPRPVNPAVRAEIIGPSATQTQWAFARFPDFALAHGGEKSDLKLTFIAATVADRSGTPIELFALAGGDLHVRFTSDGEHTTHVIRVAEPMDTPWPGMKLTVIRKYDRARLVQTFAPPPRIRERRAPAILLALNTDAENSEVWLRKDEPRSVAIGGTDYELVYADQTMPLGFQIALAKFTVGYYPGGRRPRSFESQITITVPATGHALNRIISMNHPTSYAGYTFYQSSYELSGRRATSVLSVARDPGKPIVFAGYVGLLAGMCWVLVTRFHARRDANRRPEIPEHARVNGSRRINLLSPGDRCVTVAPTAGTRARYRPAGAKAASLLREQLSKNVVRGAILIAAGGTIVHARGEAAPSMDVSAVRGVCVQHDGRYMPLDTLARDVVQSATGSALFEDHDPVVLLLAWTFAPESWADKPLITIRSKELRREIGLPIGQSVFSHRELSSHAGLRALISGLSKVEPGRKLNALETKVSGIQDKLSLLSAVFRGQAIRLIPDAADAMAPWRAPGSSGVATVDAAWAALKAAFVSDDARAFNEASRRLQETTAALPAAFRPSATLLGTELRYNRLSPFSAAWRIMLVGTVVSAVALFVRRRWFDVLAVVALVAGFGVLTYGLSLRWEIAGRIPASNMFESLLFLGWGVGAFAIVSVPLFGQRLVPLTASAMSSLALVLADYLPVDHFIRPIAPVLLDTVWMSIHVPVIMVSYSVLTLAMLVAHIQLVVMAAAPKRTELANTIDGLHYWYLQVGSLLLTAGIITGSMWAASSWGRYWGWDPKEVWSLAALLGYLTILHVRIDRERVPRWVHAVAGLLVIAVLAVLIPKLGPLVPGRLLGLAGAIAGMGVMVLARGQFATAAKSIICFWLIVMTYVGVNYVLGMGLHSYGFGTGAAARYMFMIGGLDVAFVAICALIHWLRSSALRATMSMAVAPA
jgi:ABC-type transport system involved in cytochrome c biogenesis permease subunit